MLQLKKFPDILVSTPEEARESRPHPEEPVSISYLERRDTFPACSGKNSRRSRRISRGGTLHRKGERNSRVVPHSQSPKMSQPITGKPVFPAMPRLSNRGSTHTTVARGTALWESLVGSLMGKPRGKAPDPLIHVKESVILLLQFGRKAHVYAPIRDED